MTEPNRLASKTWVPRFHHETEGDRVALYDGDERIALFHPDRLWMREVRLKPGGFPLLGGPGTSTGWRLFWGVHSPMVLDDFCLEETGPDGLAFALQAHEQNVLEEQRVQVRLRYDADLETYVYAVRLEYQAGQDVPNRGYKCEYLNFYPTGVTDPRCVGCLPDEPAVQGRPFWQAHIYEDIWERGRIVRSPFSRLYLSTQSNLRLRENGLIGCFHHPLGNPCVRLLGDTALRSTLFLCNQLWDLHFRLSEHASSRPLPKGYRMSAEYELLALDEERSRPYLERAVTLPLPEQELADRDFPRFPYVRFPASDSFEEGLRHHETELSSFWTPFARDPDVRLPPGLHWEPVRAQDQAELVWEKGYGRTGSRCLRVTTREAVAAGWQLASHNMVTLETARPYRFSAHVRTEGLKGKGATAACALAQDDALFGLKGTGQPTRLTFAGTWLVGTQPWTRVSVELPAAPALAAQGLRGHTARLVLWHEGVGTTWFDDVALEPV